MHSLMLDYGVAADFVAYDLVLVWLGPSMLTCCTSPGLLAVARLAFARFARDGRPGTGSAPTSSIGEGAAALALPLDCFARLARGRSGTGSAPTALASRFDA